MQELLVDNYAGGGGASVGIAAAMGRPVDLAVNHDAIAIAMHKINHPHTKHLNEDIWKVDPVEACAGRPVGLAWFSPDCTHHSKARGGKPVEKKIRGLAWVVIRWAKLPKPNKPRVIMLENVEEFITWGPLIKGKDGKFYPCPKRKGQHFKTFIKALKKHGYVVEYQELRACDYGAPTIRKRLFLIARCDGRPIVWPEPTHGDPKSEAVRAGKLKPWRTAAECIDWSLPTYSIFLTKEEAKPYRVKRPLADATLRRIAKGIMKYVVNAADPFIVTYYGDKNGEFRGQDIKDPLRTQTAENRHALITPFVSSSAYSKSTGRGKYVYGPGEPVRTITSSNDKLLVAPVMVRTDMHKSNAGCFYDLEAPLRTITSSGGHAIAVPYLMVNTTGHSGEDIKKPVKTLTTGNHEYLIVPTLIQTGYGERKGQAPRVPGLDKPLGTVVAGENKHALVSGFLAKHYGGVVGTEFNKPTGTVTGKDHHSLVTANLVRNMGKSVGSDLKEPQRTVTMKSKDSLVTSHVVKLKGTNIGHEADKPLHTITARGLHFGEVRAFLLKYYGTDQNPQLREPLHTVTTKDRFGVVTIHGEEYQIADIGLRMLAPRELFRAQGFPDSYIIDIGHDPRELYKGKPLTKTQQVALCGNSVCPDLARVLVGANMGAQECGAQARG